jgi:hypothetical protein
LKLIKKLQECATIGQADPILTKLNAGPAVKKLVETAIILSNSPDQQQRNHAYSFMESAIRELEDDDNDDDIKEEKMGMHGSEDELNNPTITGGDKVVSEEENNDDDKNENKTREEVLDNHNLGERTEGSDQSTHNKEPYPGEGEPTKDGENPMEDMANTVNQWSEALPPGGMPPGGMPPGQPGAMPPNGMPPNQMAGVPPNGGGMIVPGLAPDIAQEMGMGMPAPPPMDTSQMMRQMQYTVKNIINDYHKKVTGPMNDRLNATIKQQRETILQQKTTNKQQREAIKELSTELRETSASNGSMKLDLDTLRNNASAKFREIEPSVNAPTFNGMPMSGIQPGPSIKQDEITLARSQITEMDKILRTKPSEIYG